MNVANEEPFEMISSNDLGNTTTEEVESNNNEDDSAIDITWEHVDSSIHTVLLKDIWSEDAQDVATSLQKLKWDSFKRNDDGQAEVSRCNQNIEVFYRLGGYSMIVALMHKWKMNKTIQVKCCSVLIHACKKHPDLVSHAIFAGAVDCIISAMRNFPNYGDLQSVALVTLESLSNDDEYYGAQAIMKGGGLDLVIRTMKAYPSIPCILGPCCGLLYNLTYDEYVEEMKVAGVVSLLASAMEEHKSCAKIQKLARKVILLLLDDEE